MKGLILIVSKPLAGGNGYATKVKSNDRQIVADFIRNATGVALTAADGLSATVVSRSRFDRFQPGNAA